MEEGRWGWRRARRDESAEESAKFSKLTETGGLRATPRHVPPRDTRGACAPGAPMRGPRPTPPRRLLSPARAASSNHTQGRAKRHPPTPTERNTAHSKPHARPRTTAQPNTEVAPGRATLEPPHRRKLRPPLPALVPAPPSQEAASHSHPQPNSHRSSFSRIVHVIYKCA